MKEQMWNTGGMILTWENQSIWRKVCPRVTLSTKNPIHAGLGLNLNLHVDKVVTNCLSHGKGNVAVPAIGCMYIHRRHFTDSEQKFLNPVFNSAVFHTV
jgi:hypothetical protein